LLKQKGKVIGTVPDSDTEVDQKVAVFGTTASANWFKSPMGFGCWKHILDKLDYTWDYVPVK